jgi:quinohemoprotein ethanol dehydrogenase
MLWKFDARAPILSASISYEARGKQQITVIVGSGTANANFANPMSGGDLESYISDPRGQARRVLTFALGGKATLPRRPVDGAVPEDPSYVPDPAGEQAGMMTFMMHCSSCHGIDAVALATGPDLRRSALLSDKAVFAQVVRDGAMRATGMPAFEEISRTEVEVIRQYLRGRAEVLRNPHAAPPSARTRPRAGGV